MAVNLNFQCHGRGWANHVTSDGNRVNVGNFDENGLNVNNYWDDNRNYNIGLAASRQSFSVNVKYPRKGGYFI